MSSRKYQPAFALPSVALFVTLIMLGLFFRFANLAGKVFWVDEVATAIRVSGFTIAEVTEDLVLQELVDGESLLSYQKINSSRGSRDTLQALTKSPEHAPLYFLLTRVWVELWGNSISIMRSFSVYTSLLIFPCLYWLCQELFSKPLVSWIAVMLMSVSPFYVAYAQEARPYSLWTVAILFMGASFLRAIRLNTTQSWTMYSFGLMLGLYTSLFSLYVAFFQGIYFALTLSNQRLKVTRNYLIFSLFSFVAFIPWCLVIINHLALLHENTSWMRGNFSIPDIIAVLIGTNLLVFGDLPISQDSKPIPTAIALITIAISALTMFKITSIWQGKTVTYALGLIGLIFISSILLLSNYIYFDWVTIIGALVALGVLSLSVYSLNYLIANTKRDRWLFVVTLMLCLPIPLVANDIINQGQGSTAPRYLIPFQLGILIAVAFTLASKLASNNLTSFRGQKFWQLTLACCLTLGIFSCFRNLNLSPFYQKGRNTNNIAISQIINQNNSALVMVESSETVDILSLAYSLNSEVKYKVMGPGASWNKCINQFENSFKNIYVLKPSPQLKNKFKLDTQIDFEQVYKPHVFSANEFPLDLWSIK